MAHLSVSDVSSACFMFGQLKKRSPKINTLFSDLKQMGVGGQQKKLLLQNS